MLNLLYYDMKATVKRSWYYIIVIALLALLVRFFMSDAFKSFFVDLNFIYGYIISVVAAGFLGAFGVLVTLIIIVYQTQWFDENVLSSQGQLTNMLPVASWQIILSKIITALIWSLIIVVMAVGVTCIVAVNTDYFETFVKFVVEVGADNNMSLSPLRFIISVGFYIVTGITAFISLCFVSQMIGQIFGSFRNLFVFISFVAILALSIAVLVGIAPAIGVAVPESIDTNELVGFCAQAAVKLTVLNIVNIVVYWLVSSVILQRFLNVV